MQEPGMRRAGERLTCVAAALAVGFGGGDGLAARLEPQPDGPPPVCAVEIEFHARRGEIDMRTLHRVLAYVEASSAIARAYDEKRGENEHSALCLAIDGEARALAVFEALTNIVPPQRRKLPRLKPPPPVVLRYNPG